MKAIRKAGIGFFIATLLMVSLLLPAFAQSQSNIVGSWDLTVSAAEGERQVVITFKKDGEKLTGLLNGQRGDLPFESVALQGEDISWILKLPIEGQEATLSFKGKAQGSTMKGEAELGPYGKGSWSATKRPDATAAVSGTPAVSGAPSISGLWKAEFQTPDGVQPAEFTFTQESDKLTGTLKGPLGEYPVTGSVQGNEVTFSFQIKYQGEPMKIQCKGKLENAGAMSGTFTYNDQGPSTWTAKK
jgi:hypothetical protein